MKETRKNTRRKREPERTRPRHQRDRPRTASPWLMRVRRTAWITGKCAECASQRASRPENVRQTRMRQNPRNTQVRQRALHPRDASHSERLGQIRLSKQPGQRQDMAVISNQVAKGTNTQKRPQNCMRRDMKESDKARVKTTAYPHLRINQGCQRRLKAELTLRPQCLAPPIHQRCEGYEARLCPSTGLRLVSRLL